MSFYDFISKNLDMVIITVAMIVVIVTTVHLSNATRAKMVVIVVLLAALTVATYVENYLGNQSDFTIWRSILTAAKYVVPSFILALIPFTFIERVKTHVFIPALVNFVLCALSVGTGIVFSFASPNNFQRGALGYFPFAVAILYICCIIIMMLRQSHRGLTDILPAVFFILSSFCTVCMPLWLLFDFESLFCISIAINAFLFYIYVIQQLTKKDPLTGLLNRQSYYSDVSNSIDDIEAIVSIDMNGLKATNDSEGHAAGDLALKTLADCFLRAAVFGQRVYRVGGDEFMIVCFHGDEETVRALISRIDLNVSKTKYTVAVGYCMKKKGVSLDETANLADERMYAAKSQYYMEIEHDRRK